MAFLFLSRHLINSLMVGGIPLSGDNIFFLLFQSRGFEINSTVIPVIFLLLSFPRRRESRAK